MEAEIIYTDRGVNCGKGVAVSMKILMVNKFLYPQGGAETYILKTGRYLQEHGHEVQYFGMWDDRNVVGNELQLETYHMDFGAKDFSRFFYPFRVIYSQEAKRKIQRVARHFRPDVVHFNNINYQLTQPGLSIIYYCLPVTGKPLRFIPNLPPQLLSCQSMTNDYRAAQSVIKIRINLFDSPEITNRNVTASGRSTIPASETCRTNTYISEKQPAIRVIL